MEIEILVVTDCPHTQPAAELLHHALGDVGLRGTTVTTRVVTDQDEAEQCGFTGSPTFLIDGRDPFDEASRPAGLACRMYRTPEGLASLPSLDQLRQALTGALHEQDLADAQRRHWQNTYTAHPCMYGEQPSTPAVHATGAFRAAGAKDVLELGAGHGRDALYFAREGFTVQATDFSATGLQQLQEAAHAQGVAERVSTTVHDVRDRLPLPDASVDAVFAHMLLCMALSTQEIHALVQDVRRVLRPGGLFVYTVRHTDDAHYGTGTPHGDDIYEHGGFAVHFFSRHLVDALAADWTLNEVHAFEEGELPRRLWRVTQTRPQ
ncbi:class I SAM-dependent methyltransferase [Streptomyces sp. NBC_00239]|uniref:class I SAM-dependent methyltransferase n=1 Tax=Streptomyces sp. NBC_00239 TaxID=2903640 RepID=UPI002E27AED9|nr:class I SAM-dependent methyltransferase [Streptomyces sp. NBC_00239]